MSKHYDYIAIGGGSGGIASINRAAMHGARALLIEGNELGGTCVNLGCVPKKVMWHASQISESLKLYANDYGITFGDVEFDLSKLVDNRSAYIDRIHDSYERGLNNNMNSISELVEGKTLIVIAHRLSTITSADKIIVMNEGNIEAEGKHAELIENCSLYRELWNAHINTLDMKEVSV